LNKIKQSVIAWVFDKRVDKDTQLEIFVNSVHLGNHNGNEVRGLQAGAMAYFNKDFSQLDEGEFLSLLAMIIAPNHFNLVSQSGKNQERVNRIRRLLKGECQPAGLHDVYYENC